MLSEPLLLKFLCDLYKNTKSYKIILCSNDTEAQNVQNQLIQLSKDFLREDEVLMLPGFIQTGVFKYESAKRIIAKRIAIAHTLSQDLPRIVVTSICGLSRAFPKLDWIKQHKLKLQTKKSYEFEDLLKTLSQYVYTEVQQVEDVGEYAVRGSILDIWTPGQSHPTRIEFFDDEIKQIRQFRAYDQKSFKNLDSIYLLPSREFVWPDASVLDAKCESFNRHILRQKVEGLNRSNLLEDLKSSIPFPGIDDLSYMFSDSFSGFIDEFKKKLKQNSPENLNIHLYSSAKDLSQEFTNLYDIYDAAKRNSDNKNILIPKFESLFPGFSTLKHDTENSDNAENNSAQSKTTTSFYPVSQVEETLFKTGKESFQTKISNLLSLFDSKSIKSVVIASKNKDSALETAGLLANYFPEFSDFDEKKQIETYSFDEILLELDSHFKSQNIETKNSSQIKLTILHLEGGFLLPHSQTLFISENILRGRRQRDNVPTNNTSENTTAKSKQTSQVFLASQFSDFSEGDLVVHVQHGISRFKGLATIKVGDIFCDFLMLEFLGNDKIYVPVNKLNLIQKYVGASSSIQLDSLKTKAWTKRKEKIKKDVEQLAQKLIEHHAKQVITPGTAFSKIDEDYIGFEDAFPYEDTDDQQTATQDIMLDMGKPKAMDRLLCGDVGFGKTEVAMRACYRAILDGKQVAWLVPTTVLAHQHFRSLKERFQAFGVNILLLDRTSGAAASKSLSTLKNGEADILIGTHRILAKDIAFRDLGLLVVDEEQHFGVLQKEKIKTMSYGIDVLTLTATPIPRTLQMSLVGIRDLSLLTTPPKSRLATKTFVCPFDDKTVTDAVEFEVARGGQVFYVHNRVEELEGVKTYLQTLMPSVRISVGHGKMKQNELEKTILEFLEHKFDLFLCTTIVEAGIDMPNVNTIIVQNADLLGLAQLYQLRGRVGRRSTRGYAYFLVDTEKFSKTSDGMKRLEILKDHQELGSGFVIASHDLEMRGSGEILGDEQSGKVREIGLETYLQMLDDAIKNLGGVRVERKEEVDIQLPMTLQIPDSYIESARERLLIYRRFFGSRDETVLTSLVDECVDRFGEMPEEVTNLIELSRIRRLLLMIGAISLTVGENHTECRLEQKMLQNDDESSEAFIKRVLSLCNRKSEKMRITQDGRLLFPITHKQFVLHKHESLQELKRIFSLLAGTHLI